MKRLLFLLVPIACLLTTTACSPTDPYAAVVNGQSIPSSALSDELKIITSNVKYSQLLDQELSAGSGAGGLQPDGKNTVNSTYTAQLVYNRVLVALIDQAAKKDHITVSASDRTSAETSVRQGFNDDELFNSLPATYKSYLIDRQANLNAVLAFRSTPAKQQEFYDQNAAQFETYCVRHVLVQTQDEAQDLYTQIQNGADFATIAKAKSLDTGSAPQGGDLGCLAASDVSQFVEPFASAVLAATPGVVSQPLQTQYGFHLIEVTSKTKKSFADSQASIADALSSSQAFFTDALAAAKVKVNPRYGDYVPSDPSTQQVGHVVPHPANAPGTSTAAATDDSTAATDSTGSTDAPEESTDGTDSQDTSGVDPTQTVPSTTPDAASATTAPVTVPAS